MKSKSDAPLGKILTERPQTDLRTPNWWADAPVVAMDFETRDGDPFALAIDDGQRRREPPYVLESESGTPGDPLDPERVLNALASRRWSGNVIVTWFNLGFDAEVFAASLPREVAHRLKLTGHASYETEGGKQVDITYLKGKLLSFRDEHGHNVTHYDVGNLVRGSLDDNAAEWLGEHKSEDVDPARFAEDGYIEENHAEIREYAKRDVSLTRRLTVEVLGRCEVVNVPAGRPVSTGYLAAEFIRNRLDTKPGWGPSWVQALSWDAYAGGRFEVYERGEVGRVAGPDINSAYPAVMSRLPDPGTLRWRRDPDASVDALRAAEWGVVRAEVTTDPERRIQPFAVKSPEGVVTYPALDGYEVTTLIPIFLHALDAGIVTDYDVTNAALGYECDRTERPFDFFSDLYQERKRLEANGKGKAGNMLKIAMNSMYGKTAQTTLKARVVEERISPEEAASEPYERFMTVDGVPLVVSQEAGGLFNPFLASHITGLTRLQLHEAVLSEGLEDDTILLATDCIMVREDAYDASAFNERLGDTLGEWDFDYRGSAYVIGSGVYEVDHGDGLKMATRGFREAQVESLRAASEAAGDEPIPIESTRPITLGEAFASGQRYDVADVGRFRSDENTQRSLTADFDSKRDWPTESPTFGDLLSGAEYGEPLVFSD